jgi:hydrogenase maturation protease
VRSDLLIGIGNPLRGDDGVAARLLEELAREAETGGAPDGLRGAELRTVHQLTPELALAVAEAERVLFVDAWANPDCGEPWITPLQPPPPEAGLPDGHGWDPVALVALAERLYGWRGEAALLRVPAFAFPHGMDFSAGLKEALPRARALVRHWLRGGPRSGDGAKTIAEPHAPDASPLPAFPAAAAPWSDGPVDAGRLDHGVSRLQPL